MMNGLVQKLAQCIATAAGQPVPVVQGLHYWELIDLKNGGLWSFTHVDITASFSWRPMMDKEPDAFTVHVTVYGGKIDVETDPTNLVGVDRIQFQKVGLALLQRISEVDLPSSVHRELNDLFGPSPKDVFLKAEGMTPRDTTRQLGDIALLHPNPVVRRTAERTKRMYQGTALDEQKDPNKVN
jgi:hypothetical protein